ncbi:MAG: HEPN domain-containing protein [Syntrophales bacterium]
MRTARYLSEGNFHRSACYHAGQSIEKYLKAHFFERSF